VASIFLDSNSGLWHISFRFGGKQHHKSLKTADQKKAESWKARIEETLHDLERGRRQLPQGVNFWEFVKTDGQREQKLQLQTGLTLEGLFLWYFGSLPEGAKESKTFKVEIIHSNHCKRLLGANTELDAITGQDLQEKYINRRATEDYYGRPIHPDTIEKELDTLQMVWNRASRNRVPGVHHECPSGFLKYPKKKVKPPFQTWEQIEQAISRGGLSDLQVRELWDSLFLDLGQIAEVLEHVRNKKTTRRYFYPLLVFAAHTGARLSECMRSQAGDFDFQARVVRIREKKRSQASETYRWVDANRRIIVELFPTVHRRA
jgi:hypothetical protein